MFLQTVLDGTPAGSGDKEIPKVLDCGPYGNGVSFRLQARTQNHTPFAHLLLDSLERHIDADAARPSAMRSNVANVDPEVL